MLIDVSQIYEVVNVCYSYFNLIHNWVACFLWLNAFNHLLSNVVLIVINSFHSGFNLVTKETFTRLTYHRYVSKQVPSKLNTPQNDPDKEKARKKELAEKSKQQNGKTPKNYYKEVILVAIGFTLMVIIVVYGNYEFSLDPDGFDDYVQRTGNPVNDYMMDEALEQQLEEEEDADPEFDYFVEYEDEDDLDSKVDDWEPEFDVRKPRLKTYDY